MRPRRTTSTPTPTSTENVVGLAGGGFVVVWSDYSNSLDGSGAVFMGASLTPTDAPVTGDFLVNTTTATDQNQGSVGAVGTGFVVTWTSYQQDGSGSGVYAQRYDATGAAVGGEFQVNTYTPNDQISSKVVDLGDGSFVIVWTSNGVVGSGYNISGQRYDSDGNAVGGEFVVSSPNTYNDNNYNPSIALRNDGALVVAWQDSSNSIIEQKIIDDFATGTTPIGDFVVDEVVSTPIVSNYIPPEVAALADGGHVVVWSAYNGNAADSEYGVYQQRYDLAGAKVGTPELVNTTTSSHQYIPSVATTGTGWVVTGARRTAAVGVSMRSAMMQPAPPLAARCWSTRPRRTTRSN